MKAYVNDVIYAYFATSSFSATFLPCNYRIPSYWIAYAAATIKALITGSTEQMVETFGYEVVGIALIKKEALKLYSTHKPHVVLADVHLSDESTGTKAVSEILKDDRIGVLFIIAFTARLLTGEKPVPDFLVTNCSIQIG